LHGIFWIFGREREWVQLYGQMLFVDTTAQVNTLREGDMQLYGLALRCGEGLFSDVSKPCLAKVNLCL